MAADPTLIRELSDELVELQRPIRVLDAVAWGDDVQRRFFEANASKQPDVDASYYQTSRPLRFVPDDLRAGLAALRPRVERALGESPVGVLMTGRIDEYLRVIDLLEARGTTAFTTLSAELYGGIADVLHPGGPTLESLGNVMFDALTNIDSGAWDPPEDARLSAEDAIVVLRERLALVFGTGAVKVVLDDGIIADAAAGADYIKLRQDATFAERDLRLLEVHEGWVHVATSLNGRAQPVCTFLEKGTPSTTSTQEGLAVFTEVTTMSSTLARLRKVTQRMLAIAMATDGATFLEIYRWFVDQGLTETDAWASSVRVFRGSTPTGGPFTKDLAYSKGFLEVYDFIRLAVRRGLVDRVPLLFTGKLAVRELGAISALVDEGIVVPPSNVPPHIKDLSALASWMAYSNLLNRIDLREMERHLADALR